MVDYELEDIKVMWDKKYPDVDITLWRNMDSAHYFGRMSFKESSTDLCADSISALIALGEEFLRKVKV